MGLRYYEKEEMKRRGKEGKITVKGSQLDVIQSAAFHHVRLSRMEQERKCSGA